jgi:hypothetical protein
MKNEIVFHVPEFVDSDGIAYTDIQVIVEMDASILDTVKVTEALQRPLKAKDGDGR